MRADATARGANHGTATAYAAEVCAETMVEARRMYAAHLREAAAGGPCKPWVADAAPVRKEPDGLTAAKEGA